MRSLFRHKAFLYGLPAVTIGLCLALFYLFSGRTSQPPPDARLHLRYHIEIQNISRVPAHDVALEVAAPMKASVFQRCADLDSNQDFHIRNGDHGQQSFLFKWPLLPPHATKIIVMNSMVDLWRAPVLKDDRGLTAWLAAERFIESDDMQIRQLAAQLKSKDPIRTASDICEWVGRNIAFHGYTKRPRGALYALKNKNGDCTESAYLFVALCRANGIPARPIGGFVASKSTVLNLADYHDWAEFHADGRWHVADPQRKQFMNGQETYVAFQVIRPDTRLPEGLVKSIEGEGLRVIAK